MRKLPTLDTALAADEHAVRLDPSVGIALAPEHGDAPSLLPQRDGGTLDAAKRGQHGSVLDASDQDGYRVQRWTLIGALLDAIADDSLAFAFQPKVDLRTGRTHSVEALLRWSHPNGGVIPPSAFIPLAEETGLINRLSNHVLHAAHYQYERWREMDLDLGIAINLSAHNLTDRGVQAAIETMFRGGHLPPGALEIDLTETGLLEHFEEALIVLQRFHQLGVRIVVDDFGTGYSSLSYLARLPVDEIKIDRSFVTGMLHDYTHRVIVQSTIELAHNLGLDVTAEGVEDRVTRDLLAEMGCDLVQGYYVSRPLPAAGLLEWITTH